MFCARYLTALHPQLNSAVTQSSVWHQQGEKKFTACDVFWGKNLGDLFLFHWNVPV